MTEKGKNIFYVVVVLALGFVLYREYTYEIPYNYDWFMSAFFSIIPIESTYSWTWIFLLIMAVLLCLPLFKKRAIGLLGLVLLIGIICKPILVKETPVQDPISFFEPRKKEMIEFINKYKKSKENRIVNEEIEQLGFEQFQIEGDTYIFIVYSLIDNGYGFCYDEDGVIPTSILGASSFFEKIDSNWYKFTST